MTEREITDFESLRHAHATLLEEFNALVEEKALVEQRTEHLERENQALRAVREELIRRLFGRRSEKVSARQLALFTEASEDMEQARLDELKALDQAPDENKKPKKRGRKRAPAVLERRRTEYTVEEEDRRCPCCSEVMEPFGAEVSEELEYIPAKVFVQEHARMKYSCRNCPEGVVTAMGPSRPIEKGKGGPSLLSHIIVSKYGDHQPLYRLEQIFDRLGVDISRKTMSGWIGQVVDLVEPVVKAMKEELKREPLIQSDDTPVQYQDRRLRGRTARGYLWTYTKPWGEVVYDFTTSRSREGPLKFLEGYRGYLQVDGYAGYNEVLRKEPIERIGCMAHVRRKFYEARAEAPELATAVIAAMQKLYRVEKKGNRPAKHVLTDSMSVSLARMFAASSSA